MDSSVEIDEKIALIKNQACFGGFNDKETLALAELFIEQSYPSGSVIVKQGAPVDKVYLIVKGTADVLIVNHQISPEPKMVATLGPRQAIGLSETGFYSLSGMRTATVVAQTDMILLCLSVARFNGFALSNAHVTEVMRKFSGAKISDASAFDDF